jgi:hypothetical protein
MAYTPQQLAIIADLEASTDGSPIDVDDFLNGEAVEALTWNSRQSLEEALFTRLWHRVGQRYLKPALGILETDLENSVIIKLNQASTAYQMPPGGIPATDLNISWKAPVTNLTALNAVVSPLVGDVRYVNAEAEIFKFTGSQWERENQPAGGGGNNPLTTTGLNYGYLSGFVRNDNVVNAFSSGTIPCAASSTTYIEVSSGAIVSSTNAGFTSGKIPLAVVTTDATSITSFSDKRDALLALTGSGRLRINTFTAGSPTQAIFPLNFNASNPAELLLFANGTAIDPSYYSWTTPGNNLTISPALSAGTRLMVIGGEFLENPDQMGIMTHFEQIGISDGVTTDYQLPIDGPEEYVVLGYGQHAIRNLDYVRISLMGVPYIQFLPGRIPPTGVNILASVATFTSITPSVALLDHLAEDPDGHLGLDYAYKAGRIRSGATVVSVGASVITLTASSTNFIQCSSLGVVNANTVGFSVGNIPIAEVTTDALSILVANDKRTWLVV